MCRSTRPDRAWIPPYQRRDLTVTHAYRKDTADTVRKLLLSLLVTFAILIATFLLLGMVLSSILVGAGREI
jgi:hypothetical protein